MIRLFAAFLLFGALVLPASGRQSSSLSLQISNTADYSADVREFALGDRIYFRVIPPAGTVDETSFELKPKGSGDRVSGVLANDGTGFAGSILVADLLGAAQTWNLRLEVRMGRNRLRATADLEIERPADGSGDNGGGGNSGNTGNSSKIRGTVTNVATDGTITVAGTPIMTGAFTRFTGQFTDLASLLNETVQVKVRQTDRGLEATLVTVITSRDVVSFKGKIKTVSGTTLEVRNLEVLTDGSTTVTGDDGRDLTLGDLMPGMHVEVSAVRTDAAWYATDITVLFRQSNSDDGRDRMEGQIEALSPPSMITVGGLQFLVSDQTRLQGFDRLESLEVGQHVSIEFVSGDAGLEARVIAASDKSDNPDQELRVRGEIACVIDNTFDVDGIVFTVTNDTVFSSGLPFEIGFADLIPGIEVEVLGMRRSDGTNQLSDRVDATQIRVKKGLATLQDIEGPVEAVRDGELEVGGTTIVLTAHTKFQGDRNQDADALEVGQSVRVSAIADRNGTLYALRVKVLKAHERDDVGVHGTLSDVSLSGDSGTITINDLVFHLHDQTQILDRAGDFLYPQALVVGMRARVEAFEENGQLIADEIRVNEKLSVPGRLIGPVTGRDAGSITVAGARFEIDSGSRIKADDADSQLDVRFRHRADGSLYAERVSRTQRTAVLFSGTLEDATGGVIIASGVRIDVSAADLEGPDGAAIGLDDLRPDQPIRVEGDWSDAFIATRVKVRDLMMLSGSVATRGTENIEVAGLSFALTDETEVIGSDGSIIDAADIPAEAYLEIVAAVALSDGTNQLSGTNGTNQFTATQVSVLATVGASTTGAESADLPMSFTLGQNYPNPFNPATRIHFEMPAGISDVRLEIVDVLGRRIRILAAGPRSGGRHEVSWDGRSDAGFEVPSAIYIYTLTVGGERISRTMTLLR